LSILSTYHDLYLAIEELSEQHKSSSKSLEQYLLALLFNSKKFAEYETLSIKDFHNLLTDSFTTDFAGFNETWRDRYNQLTDNSSDFIGWQSTLIRQIVDLHEMAENGSLANELRYFGIESPRNSRWYNFDPFGYLSCAIAGSVDGWEPYDESDEIDQEVTHQNIQQSEVEIFVVTWEQFKDFIYCGQVYE
jgi:hypothetical protein